MPQPIPRRSNRVTYNYYVFDCEDCNYTCSSKTESTYNLTIRLHKKKCKKTGRTEGNVVNEHIKKWDRISEIGKVKDVKVQDIEEQTLVKC